MFHLVVHPRRRRFLYKIRGELTKIFQNISAKRRRNEAFNFRADVNKLLNEDRARVIRIRMPAEVYFRSWEEVPDLYLKI